MKQQWYRSNAVKGILIAAMIALSVGLSMALVWFEGYPDMGYGVWDEPAAKTYGDTRACEQLMMQDVHQIAGGVGYKNTYEKDGEFDADKIVDIESYYETETISGKNESGLAYKLGDLQKWAQQWDNNGEVSSDTADETGDIIVCKKPDGSYYYYFYDEFKSLVNSKKLNFIVANVEEGTSTEDIMAQLSDGAVFEQSQEMFKGLQDEQGKILYIDCWNYDGTWVEELAKPVDGESVLDIANKDSRWNGRLNEAYEKVMESVYYMQSAMIDSTILEDQYNPEYSNIRYLFVDSDNQKVYSNESSYEDIENVEANIEKIKALGKYAVITPDTKEFETNLSYTDAAIWRDGVSYSFNGADFLLVIGLDTTYTATDQYYSENETFKLYEGTNPKTVMGLSIMAVVLGLAALIWLTIVAGRRPEETELYLNGFDRWKTELAAGCVIILWLGVFFIGVSMLRNGSYQVLVETVDGYAQYGSEQYFHYGYGGYSTALKIEVAAVAAYTCIMFLIGYLSLVRRIKAKTLWKNSLLRMFGSFVVQVVRNLPIIGKTILIFGCFVFIHWIALITYSTYGAFFWFLIMIFADMAAFVYVVRQAIGKHRIQKGITTIASGEVDYKIPLEGLSGEQWDIANDINSIGEGLDAALEKSMKSERLKTDLITNVSHDIKTPLTSIISYVELLKQENFEDPKIRRYIEVLEQKSQRLKTLTEDVVEASKVSSGNITLEYMNLNLVELIQQTSGEFEEKFNQRSLTEVLNLPEEEVIINADGRRLWRILSNIYNNAAKYAMEGTRVYADLSVEDGKAKFSLKNVSQQALNISSEELTERFIRGDISRSTEGSGLGLSIAKSLTEMQQGEFELYVDGDLFRVTIKFPKV